MAVAFVKSHTGVSNKTAGTTLAVPLDTIVPAGNLIVARVLYDNAATASKPLVSSIGVAAGETNTWQTAGAINNTSTSAGSFASGTMRYILTTVAWPAASYTVTLDTSATQKAAMFQEFSGVLATQRSTSGSALSATTSPASASTTGTTPVIGDLALGFIFGPNVATAQAGDTDTTGGAWSAAVGFGSTGGNITTNNFGIGQYKILTAASQQTLNNSSNLSAGNCVIVAILQAIPVPSITQAAYRLYDQGTESGSVALQPQDTAHTGDLTLGDGLGSIRIRLQSTTAVAVPATDDFILQYEKNASGSWVGVPGGSVTSYDDPNLTHAAATTNRLGAGTGSFVAGKVSENGTILDLGWTANNYTEVLYSVKFQAIGLVDGDVVRFRVLRNGATTEMTYTVTPTVNIIKTVVPKELDGSSSGTSTTTSDLAADRPLDGAADGLSTTTSALEVATPFDPLTSIAWNTVFWASDPSETPPANGATVTAWRQPGSITSNEWANHGAPKFVSNWLNGKPAIRFLQGDRLWADYAATTQTWVSVALVAQAAPANGETDFFDDPRLDGTNPRILFDRSGGQWRLYRGSLPASSTSVDDNPHLFIVRFNGNVGGDYIKKDGVQVLGPTATGTQINRRIALGSSADNAAHQDGHVAFLGVIVGRDFTAQEQADLLAWYEEFYLTLPPPGPVDLAGSSSGLSTTTSTLARAVPMVAAAGGLSTVTSALIAARPLAGASTGLSTVTSATAVARALAGSTAGSATTVGDTALVRGLAATVAGLSTTAATLSSTGDVFDPTTITGLAVWLDASELTPGDLAVWPNLGSESDPAMVATPLPQVMPNTLRGKPVVRFTYNAGRLRGTSSVNKDFTIIYVVRRWGANVGRALTVMYPGIAQNNFVVGYHTSSADWMYDNGNVNSPVGWVGDQLTHPTAWRLYGTDGTTTPSYISRFFIDGVQTGVDWTTGNGLGGTYNLSGYANTEETMDCEVAELVMYDHKLAEVERIQVEDYLRDKWLYVPPPVEMAGASSGLSTASTSLSFERSLVATATSGSTVTATTIVRVLATTAASGGLSTVTGALGLAKPLAAGVAGASTATGTLAVARSLTASTAGVSTVTAATVARAVPLAASVAGLATVTSAMATADALVANAAGIATVNGALAVARSLSASAAGVATTSAIAVVSGAGGMTAFVIGTSTVTGALGVARSLAGGTSGTTVSTGALAKIVQLSAASSGSSTTTAATAVARRLTGSSAGATTVTADFVGSAALAGSSSGSATSSALFGKAIPVAAASAGSSTATGVRVAVEYAMDASSDGSSTVTGTTPRIARALTAVAGGSTTVTADALAVVLDMMASSNGISATAGDLGLVAPMYGVWNGQAFDAMMYGPYEVVDFLLIPPA